MNTSLNDQGKPLVAIIPYEWYQKLLEECKEFFRMTAEVQAKGASDNDAAEIDRDIDKAIKAYWKGLSV